MTVLVPNGLGINLNIAEAVFGDLELKDNVLANICQYQILNQGLQVRSIGAILEGYRQQFMLINENISANLHV